MCKTDEQQQVQATGQDYPHYETQFIKILNASVPCVTDLLQNWSQSEVKLTEKEKEVKGRRRVMYKWLQISGKLLFF